MGRNAVEAAPSDIRLIFMGTPEFAAVPMVRLHEMGFVVAGVVTAPDRPAGRGRKVQLSAVKVAAQERSLFLMQPKLIRNRPLIDRIRQLAPDFIVVVAYGKILPPMILSLPRYAAINLHPSLLPRYRGPAPVNWAVLRGERYTGVTVIKMEDELDAGAMYLQERYPVPPRYPAGRLLMDLAEPGAALLAAAMLGIAAGELHPTRQAHDQASYAPMLTKEQGRIDWRL
ncbi:methionyl-tRNA formyltransferase, partial [bacterium]|nr:methionyl-tRNA formyltransferase [candidate division CSSED10-310 bacterium]